MMMLNKDFLMRKCSVKHDGRKGGSIPPYASKVEERTTIKNKQQQQMETNTTKALQVLQEKTNAEINSCISSVFTKDDVIKIIDSLFEKVFDIQNEEEGKPINLPTNFGDILKDIIYHIDFRDYTEVDNARFEIDYSNEVSLSEYGLDVNTNRLSDDIHELIVEKLEEQQEQTENQTQTNS
jgi:hypothetical protein